MTAEVADGWLPLFFLPEKAKDVWGADLDAGSAKRAADLGTLQIAAGGLVAIGDGDEPELRNMARPMAALYIGGMGAKGRNFYNELVAPLRLRAGGRGDPGPLPRRQEGRGRGQGPRGPARGHHARAGPRATWPIASRPTARPVSPRRPRG